MTRFKKFRLKSISTISTPTQKLDKFECLANVTVNTNIQMFQLRRKPHRNNITLLHFVIILCESATLDAVLRYFPLDFIL